MLNRTDEELIAGIQGTPEARNDTLQSIYSDLDWKLAATNFVMANGGNEADAKDIFQESLVLFDRNIRLGKFAGNSSLKTYFFAIAKRRWWKQLKQRQQQAKWADMPLEATEENVEDLMIEKEQKALLDEAFKNISERCQTIFKLYKLSFSMAEIAEKLKFSSAELAKKEAYRCRKRFRKFLETHPQWKDLIMGF